MVIYICFKRGHDTVPTVCKLRPLGTTWFAMLIVSSAVWWFLQIIFTNIILCCDPRSNCSCCNCCCCKPGDACNCCFNCQCCGCINGGFARIFLKICLFFNMLFYIIVTCVWSVNNPLLNDPNGYELCYNDNGNGSK